MSNAFKSKIFSGVTSVAMLLSLTGAPVAFGQTTADLQAQINSLLATIATLQAQLSAPSSSAACTFTRSLTVGSTGADVTCLQNVLIAGGYLKIAAATGYFGNLTKAAVAAWQAAHGVAPAAGYFGPISQAKYISMVVVVTPPTTTPPTTTPPPSLSGGAGSVDSYDLQSEFSNENVGEGEEEVNIMSFEVDVDNGSDLDFTSMKVWFENQDTGSSEDLDDYAESVQIWLDGNLVGEADVDEFSADDTTGDEPATDGDGVDDSQDEWEKTISLDNAVIDAGETGEFTISITAVNNIDSTDHDSDNWDVDVTNVRFEDASGAVISEDPGFAQTTFEFGTFATAASVEMQVSLANDSPDAQVVNVDDENETEGVELLVFDIEAEGSDITIHDIPVLLTVAQPTVTDDVDFIVNNLILTADGQDYSESVSTSAGTMATITFDDLDILIEEGDTLTFTVSADVNDTQASEFIDGDTLKAELTASEINAIDADDQEGDSISDDDATGTALGDTMSFYDVGIMVNFVSATESLASESTGADNDAGQFVIKFTVEAFDGTVYVSDTADSTADYTVDNSAIDENLFLLDESGTATVEDMSDAVTYTTSDGASESTAGNIQLEDGESTEITLTVVRTNDSDADDDGLYRLLLQAIAWDTVDNTYVNASDIWNVYDFDLTDFKTDPLSIN